MTHADFDAITLEQLRARGAMKWTMFPDTIGAFVAEMDFGIAPPVREALVSAIDGSGTGYLPAQLAARLSDATAARYRDAYGWDVPAERVHHVPDVIAALELTIEHFTAPGSAVIVPTPAYMPFLTVPGLHDRRVIEVPSIEVDGRMTIDLDGVARAFDDGGGLLVLCNPHNPLGTVMRRDELEAVAAVVDAKGGRVFADEIHAPVVYAPATHVPYASVNHLAAGHTVTAASASKAWHLAGMKCAQLIISNDADAETWRSLGEWGGHGTATLGVVANIAAYTEGGPWLADVVAYLDSSRRLLVDLVREHLPEARVRMPEGTYIALIDLRAYGIDGDLGEWFRSNAGVAVTDGRACGAAGVGHVRFVFALPQPLIREAVARMGRALASRI